MSRQSQLFGAYALIFLGVVFIAVGIFEIGLQDPHASIRNHHIQHVFFILGGGLLGIAISLGLTANRSKQQWPGSGVFLALAIVLAAGVMVAMWPSFYPVVEANELLHTAQHSFYIGASLLATLFAYLFSRSAGWFTGFMMAAMAWAAAYGFGVTPGPSTLIEAVEQQQAAALAAGAPVDGQAVYVNCQACHQADGSGIPSAFPPLNGHVPELLAADGGREYLLQVVLYGIQGPITALGGDYNAVMVAWGSLGDAEVAAVANYVSTAWDNSFPDAQEPYTAADVAAQRGNPLTPTEVHSARQTLAVP